MNPVLRAIRIFQSIHPMNSSIYPVRLTKYSTLPSEAVIFMNDDMVVCWHPEKPFPYECSLPLPEEKSETDSVLRIGDKEVASIFRKKKTRMMCEELAKITYTTKHRWFPRSRDKKAKKTEPDRPYL